MLTTNTRSLSTGTLVELAGKQEHNSKCSFRAIFRTKLFVLGFRHLDIESTVLLRSSCSVFYRQEGSVGVLSAVTLCAASPVLELGNLTYSLGSLSILRRVVRNQRGNTQLYW